LSFCDEEVAAIVDEAHRRKLRVACHARSAAAVKQAVRAGVDFIGHANYLDDEAVELLAQHREHVFVGPAIAWEVQYVARCESLGVSKATVRRQGYEAEIDATVATVAKLRAAHVRLVVGGDYGISIAPHGTYAKDLEYFVELFGMSKRKRCCARRETAASRSTRPAASVRSLRIARRSRRRRRRPAQRHPRAAEPRAARGNEGRALVRSAKTVLTDCF
jgi:hypothetical protein